MSGAMIRQLMRSLPRVGAVLLTGTGIGPAAAGPSPVMPDETREPVHEPRHRRVMGQWDWPKDPKPCLSRDGVKGPHPGASNWPSTGGESEACG